MADRPILFSAPMVRAILDGRKTQTRRLLTKAHVFATPDRQAWTLRGADLARALQNADRFRHMGEDSWFWESDAFEWQAPALRTGWLAHIGYAPGDRLWVREACRAEELSRPPTTRKASTRERRNLNRVEVTVLDELDGMDGVRYLADDTWQPIRPDREAGERWSAMFHYRGRGTGGVGNNVSPRHMPRWASRITLAVTDVRVQRLQEISEEDAMAEGALLPWTGTAGTACDDTRTGLSEFEALWNIINAKRAPWESNPWVVSVTFDPVMQNIDQISEAAWHGR